MEVNKDVREMGGMEEEFKDRTTLRTMFKRMKFQDEPAVEKTGAFKE